DRRLRLGAPGPDLAVRAVDRTALGRRAVSAAPLAGTLPAADRRSGVLPGGGAADPGLHRGCRAVRAGRPAQRGAGALPASCADQPDHEHPAIALLLPAEPVAPATARRAAGTHRGP